MSVFADLPGDHRWMLDLIARDAVVRNRALSRHQALLAATAEAWNRWSQVRADTSVRTAPRLAAEKEQAWAAYRSAEGQTMAGPIAERRVPYLVLYLRWEARYPQEWGAPGSWRWSPWSTKEVVLSHFDRHGVPSRHRAPVADLIIAALGRPYRCKDWRYAPLVRHVVDKPFLARVEALHEADDPLVRLRARFITHVARHPEQRVKQRSWQRWIMSDVDE